MSDVPALIPLLRRFETVCPPFEQLFVEVLRNFTQPGASPEEPIMHNGTSTQVKNEILPWLPPSASVSMCEKCGHVGQLWQWWKIFFCRACLCFSVHGHQRSQ
jgi:hypothetical protein